jgi:hypothetical protein
VVAVAHKVVVTHLNQEQELRSSPVE